MRSKLSEKDKLLAYALHKEFGYKQGAIADFMATKQHDKRLSQSTIANAIKEANYLLKINHLEKEYSKVKQELYDMGLREQKKLINHGDFIEIGFKDVDIAD